jgi:hypothetical protein
MRAWRVVAGMLGVQHVHQDSIIFCLVDRVKYSWYFIVFLVLQYILGYQEFHFSVARRGEYMYVSVPTAEMVGTLHGNLTNGKRKRCHSILLLISTYATIIRQMRRVEM